MNPELRKDLVWVVLVEDKRTTKSMIEPFKNRWRVFSYENSLKMIEFIRERGWQFIMPIEPNIGSVQSFAGGDLKIEIFLTTIDKVPEESNYGGEETNED